MIARKLCSFLFNMLIGINIKLLIPFRALLLRLSGAVVGKNLKINSLVVIDYPWRLSFGNHVSVNQFSKVSAIGYITIGDRVSIAHGVSILSATHPASRNFKFDPLITRKIEIGSDVWIGANSTVMASIGDSCVIGAHSLVSCDITEPGVYVGVPARKVKEL